MIGFVFQNFSFIVTDTVLENVELPLLYRGLTKRSARPIVMDYLKKSSQLKGRGVLASKILDPRTEILY